MEVRRRVVLAVLLALLAAGLSVALWRLRPSVGAEAAGPVLPDPEAASVILAAWDARRAGVWAAGDPHGLGELYLPGSAAGAADVARLTAYVDRGLWVDDMTRQVLEVRTVARTTDELRLRVTDRLASATVVGEEVRTALPATRAATRTIVLRRVAGEWLVVETYDQPR